MTRFDGEEYDPMHQDRLADHAELTEWPECDICGIGISFPDEAVGCEFCGSVLCKWDAVPLDLEDGTWRCKGRHLFRGHHKRVMED